MTDLNNISDSKRARRGTARQAPRREVIRDSMGRRVGSIDIAPDGKMTYRDDMGRRTGTVSASKNGQMIQRDLMGRIVGTITTNQHGQTIFRDKAGKKIGTSNENKYGKVVYRDSMGQRTGSSIEGSNGKTKYWDDNGNVSSTVGGASLVRGVKSQQASNRGMQRQTYKPTFRSPRSITGITNIKF